MLAKVPAVRVVEHAGVEHPHEVPVLGDARLNESPLEHRMFHEHLPLEARVDLEGIAAATACESEQREQREGQTQLRQRHLRQGPGTAAATARESKQREGLAQRRRRHLRQGLEDCGGHDSGPEQRVQREGRSAASCPAGWSRSCGAARRRAGATRRGRRSEGRWRRAAEVPEAATRLGRSCPRAARSTWARGSSRSALVGGATGSRASFARHSLAVGSRCSGAKMAPSARFRSTR